MPWGRGRETDASTPTTAAADPAAQKVWEQQKAYLARLYEYAEANEKDIYAIR
jgi:TRAP-type mannitol/chloroaromatic compound transport system substrate-binding protein